MNNKSDLLKKSSTILLATVLVAGFIGISSPSSIFAQEYYDGYEAEEYSQYYDEYEKSYEKYMKDDNSKPSIQKITINCDNSNRNPSLNNLDTGNALDLSNGDSQTDRMNTDGYSDKEGNFVSICQNNNVNIENTISNGDTSFSFVNNNTLQQNQNGTFTISMICGNNIANTEGNFTDSDNVTSAINIGNNVQCTINQTQTGNITDNTENNPPGVTNPNSSVDAQQPSVQSQQIKSLQNNNGISIQQQRTGDSLELTAMDKITKLKTQWLNQLP